MPETFADYLGTLQSPNQTTESPGGQSFADYLGSLRTQQPPPTQTFADYLGELQEKNRNVLPTIDDMAPKDDLGFVGALWSGFKSGISLGYFADEDIDRESMTFGEEAAELVGELGGGLVPFVGLGTITGGAAAPVVGASRMAKAYKSIQRMAKASKEMSELGKKAKMAEDAKDLVSLERILGELKVPTLKYADGKKALRKYKKEYLDELSKSGASARKIKAVTKAPVYPKAGGLLGKRKFYQNQIQKVAENWGPTQANLLNRFANSAVTFSSVGLLSNKPGEGIMDRVADMPKDVAMGMFFTAAGVPSTLGIKGSAALESLSILGIGAYSDYLTGAPDPEMDIRDRLLHGLTLLGFHGISHGLSNVGVKEKMFNSLVNLGFDPPVAYSTIWENKPLDTRMAKTRNLLKKEGIVFKNKKDSDNYAALISATAGKEGENSLMVVKDLLTGELKPYSGKTLKDARMKLAKEYEKIDYTDKKMMDDVPAEIRENFEYAAALDKELRGIDIKEETKESIKKRDEIDKKIEGLNTALKHQRGFRLVEVDPKTVTKGKKPVIDIRKDIDLESKWLKEEKEYLEKIEGESIYGEEGRWLAFRHKNWPERYNWMKSGERKTLRAWIFNAINGKLGKSLLPKTKGQQITGTPEQLQERINEMYRKPAIMDKSRRIEETFPLRVNTLKKGDIIVVPKVLRHSTEADAGTGKAFDYNESQLGLIVKRNLKSNEGDRYVPVPDKNTVRISTQDLISGETFELNIRIGRSRPKSEDASVYNKRVMSENRKGIAEVRKELEKKTEEEGNRIMDPANKRTRWIEPPEGLPFEEKPLLNPSDREKYKSKKILNVRDEAMFPIWLTREGKFEEHHSMLKKIDEWVEPDIRNESFLKSVSKPDPKYYESPQFIDASTLSEGSYFKKFYTPELYYTGIDKQGHSFEKSFDRKNIESFPGELIFDSEAEAFKSMIQRWELPTPKNNYLTGFINNLESQRNKHDYNPDYKEFKRAEGAFNSKARQLDIPTKDAKVVLETLFPETKGDTKQSTTRQLKKARRFLEPSNSNEIYEGGAAYLPPNDFSTKVSKKYRRAINLLKEITLPVQTVFEPLGYAGKRIAEKMERFSLWRSNVMGTVAAFERTLDSQLKKHGTSFAEVSRHVQVERDKLYEGGKASKEHKKFVKDMEAIEIVPGKNAMEFVKESFDNFYGNMAKFLISSNSWVKTIDRKGKVKNSRFVDLRDKNGDRIRLVELRKDSELHFEQVESFHNFIKNEDAKTVKDIKGNDVVVDRKKSKFRYEPSYSPRMVTDRFMELTGIGDDHIRKAVSDLKNSDEIRNLDISEARKDELARQMLSEIINMRGPQGVYGKQWGRVAELHPYYYLSRDADGFVKVINITKDNVFKDGKPHKKGDRLRDITDREFTIDEVVETYETDYGKVLKKYTDGISHSTAAAHAYGSGEHSKILSEPLAQDLARETGDAHYGQFARKVLNNQLYGETRTLFDNVFRPLTRWSALAGLSFPVSAYKNLLLGNVQNATVFTSRELVKTIRKISSREGWKNEFEMAYLTGSVYTGAYDLFLTSKPLTPGSWLRNVAENAGFMKTTERFNRFISQAIGPFALEIHVENAAGIKNPSTIGISEGTSRRMLIDVLKFSGKEIDDMIIRARASKELNAKTDFTKRELMRARQRAHIVTQGSGDLPYVPYWMGKQWARPMTLFYRIAYRMTDTVAKNVIKPIIVDGNMVPAMKYLTATTGAGMSLYAMYDWILGEERVNQFKSTPSHLLDYFLKAEGLAIFSNAFDEYGGVVDSYEPVVWRNTKAFYDNMYAFVTGKKTFVQAGGDGLSEIVAAYNGYKRVWDNITGDTQKRFKDSRRRQTQFLDAFYPKEPLDIDYDDGINTKTAYYRALRDVFWIDDNQRRAQSYYAALNFLKHRIMAEKGYSEGRAEREARTQLKNTVSRLRPIPSSWRKTPGRTRKSKYHEYYTRLSDGQRAEEDAMDALYIRKKQELYKAIRDYKLMYYKRG